MNGLYKMKKEKASPRLNMMFNNIKSSYGKVLNLYSIMGNSENALDSYLKFSGAQNNNSFSPEEREIIYLVTSETNGCIYCVSAHTLKAKSLGLKEEEIIEIREGSHPDPKIDALIKVTKEIITKRGNVEQETADDFYAAGYNQINMIDLLGLITEMTFSNYLGRLARPSVDFEKAPILADEVII